MRCLGWPWPAWPSSHPRRVSPTCGTHYEERARHYATQLNGAGPADVAAPAEADNLLADDMRRLRRELITVERGAALDLRNRGVIGDAALRRLQRALDLEDVGL